MAGQPGDEVFEGIAPVAQRDGGIIRLISHSLDEPIGQQQIADGIIQVN